MSKTPFVNLCMKTLVPELVGLTITGAAVDESGEYWGFTAEGGDDAQKTEKVVFVLSDPEGNGPGFLAIQGGENGA